MRIFQSKAKSFKMEVILNPDRIDENIRVAKTGSGWYLSHTVINVFQVLSKELEN